MHEAAIPNVPPIWVEGSVIAIDLRIADRHAEMSSYKRGDQRLHSLVRQPILLGTGAEGVGLRVGAPLYLYLAICFSFNSRMCV